MRQAKALHFRVHTGPVVDRIRRADARAERSAQDLDFLRMRRTRSTDRDRDRNRYRCRHLQDIHHRTFSVVFRALPVAETVRLRLTVQ